MSNSRSCDALPHDWMIQAVAPGQAQPSRPLLESIGAGEAMQVWIPFGARRAGFFKVVTSFASLLQLLRCLGCLRLCVANDVVISSDEVWGEMPLTTESPFTSLLRLLPNSAPEQQDAGIPGLRERLILLISPSKCFNIASLDLAVARLPP